MESGVGKNHSGGTIFVLDQRGVLFPLQIDFLFWTGTPRDNETNIKILTTILFVNNEYAGTVNPGAQWVR